MGGRTAASRRRILGTVPLILEMGVIVFAFVRLLPGDLGDIMMGKAGAVSAEEMATLRRELNRKLQAWEHIYNTLRPHQALGHLTPHQFLLRHHARRM